MGEQDEASTKVLLSKPGAIPAKWKANTRLKEQSVAESCCAILLRKSILKYALHIECRKRLASMPGKSIRYNRHDVHATNQRIWGREGELGRHCCGSTNFPDCVTL